MEIGQHSDGLRDSLAKVYKGLRCDMGDCILTDEVCSFLVDQIEIFDG